ncbi:sigma-70 family RNA polymerase sigma factor [Rosistilla carotiformis]|uniref:sigma-70 family RNA polymerase sigma factor n=1 Tax=Rosistilla carotiformis TaxID=2528017 RepID=UPI00119D3EC8|nr:sigma-70 family RNA polymerase sigma factor [Rosistilla carotiformis]
MPSPPIDRASILDTQRHLQFAERVVKNQQRVYRYIVSLVPNRADAEDLFQQTCLTLWEQWDRYDPALDFVPWACGIAHNHVRNFYRKRENSQLHLDPDVIVSLSTESMKMQSGSDERIEAIERCLQKMTPRNREVLESYYGGRSITEIAGRSSTPNAIYKQLDRIRAALHQCVTARLAGEGLQ